ncbi:MAG TPA: LPS assembly lipoprotein LptE [Tepidisphaeraceae bacterium]|nr:LPS assembly lipoprotein LptE [Tepidisphaeraceae bacterium]
MRALRFAIFALPVLVAGCGYSTNGSAPAGDYQWRSLYRQDVRTVAVPIFNTKSFNRGDEFRLTTAVAKQIEARTPYKLAPRERADTILEGEVVLSRVTTVSERYYTAQPQEQLMVATVNFTWKDLRTGQILVERRGFEDSATYYPTLGEGRYYASQETAERLAVAIVQELQAEW